jgi:hypothetical protein
MLRMTALADALCYQVVVCSMVSEHIAFTAVGESAMVATIR